MSSITSDTFNYLLIAILPGLITRYLQSFWYSLTIRVGEPHPAPGSLVHTRHNLYIHTLVILLYLLYTLYSTHYTLTYLQPNFYSILGLLPSSLTTPQALKLRWRKLSLLHHPDKSNSPDAENYFLHLQQAYNVLSNPVKRFAYDRFGQAAVLNWGKDLKTNMEFIQAGIMREVPYYVGTGGVLIVLSVLGKLEFARWWRFWALAMLAVVEGYVVTRSGIVGDFDGIVGKAPVSWLVKIWAYKPLLPFELRILARRLIVAFFMGVSQLGPLYERAKSLTGNAQGQTPASAAELAMTLRPQLARLEAMARVMEGQAGQALATEFMPFQGDEARVQVLEERLGEHLVETQVRGDEGVRSAIGRAMRRRA